MCLGGSCPTDGALGCPTKCFERGKDQPLMALEFRPTLSCRCSRTVTWLRGEILRWQRHWSYSGRNTNDPSMCGSCMTFPHCADELYLDVLRTIRQLRLPWDLNFRVADDTPGVSNSLYWPPSRGLCRPVRKSEKGAALYAVAAPRSAISLMAEKTISAEIVPAKTRRARDPATIIAISIVAFAIANLLHEGAGHGGACVLTGGHAKVLSTVHFECSQDSRLIAAGGTFVNFMAGFLCWFALRSVNQAHGHLRYFLWLLMTINLLQATGYFLFSGLGNFGDWAYVIHGLAPAWLWRGVLTVLGAVSYVLAVWLALLELRPFLGEPDWRRGGAKDLTLVPYIAGGILYTVAGMFNPVGMILVGLSAAAASFGGTSGMAWMTQYVGSRFAPRITCQPFTMQRRRGWIIAAAVTAAVFVGVLGRGVSLP